MARLTLSYQDVWQKVGEFIGMVASGTAPTGQDLTDVKDIVARGLRQFLYPIDARSKEPHEWSFLSQYWTFQTVGNQWKYALPLDFSDLLSDIVFDTAEGLPPLVKRSAEQIKNMRNYSDSSGWPEFYAITSANYDLDAGSSYELWLYPKPSQAYTFATFYRIDPLQPSATTDLMVGGISATEAILESCLAVAEQWSDDMATTHHTAKAAELIQTLIRYDAGKTDSDLIGNLYRPRPRWPGGRGMTEITDANIYTDRS
jgi:hypothetical protein